MNIKTQEEADFIAKAIPRAKFLSNRWPTYGANTWLLCEKNGSYSYCSYDYFFPVERVKYSSAEICPFEEYLISSIGDID